jgi:hypothetical protein
MGFIDRECAKLNEALRRTPADTALYRELYAAQMALAWTSDPAVYASPVRELLRGNSILQDMEANSEGCPSSCSPA